MSLSEGVFLGATVETQQSRKIAVHMVISATVIRRGSFDTLINEFQINNNPTNTDVKTDKAAANYKIPALN